MSNFFSMALFAALLLLTGCGGGDGGSNNQSSAGNEASSDSNVKTGDQTMSVELFIGYYAEDPGTNPEDPTEGALFLTLPSDGGAFSGGFSFTYVGCQGSNVGLITGTKTASSLEGQWSGNIDESPQSGFFQGDAGSGSSAYAGTYIVSGGKQFLVVPSCISYYIAPNGLWELFRLGETYSASGNEVGPVVFREFDSMSHKMNWTAPDNAVRTLVFIVDIDLAATDAAKAVVWQSLMPGQMSSAFVPLDAVSSDRRYAAGVASTDGAKLLYFSTTQFEIGQ